MVKADTIRRRQLKLTVDPAGYLLCTLVDEGMRSSDTELKHQPILWHVPHAVRQA